MGRVKLEHELKKGYHDARLYRVLAPLPLVRHLEDQYTAIHSFHVPGFCMGIANCVVEFPPGVHAHTDFEFMIPLNDTVPTVCDKRIILAEAQKVLPFNPGQYHGPGDHTVAYNGFIALSCEENYVRKAAQSVFGRSDIQFVNESFNFTNDMRLLVSLFIEEDIGKQCGSEFMKENLANMLIACVFRTAASNLSPQGGEKAGANESKRIRRAAEFLKANFASEFSMAEVSAVAEISPFYFIKQFKLQTGKTPYEFVLDIKIDRAKELLAKKGKNITEVCISCGFNNPSHFSSIFKRKTGVSPTEYRRLIHLDR